jgi:hypothetical protein
MLTMNPAVNAGGTSWRLSWTSDGPGPFYVYDLSEGGLIGTTYQTAFTITLEPGESRVIEVRESAYAVTPRGYPSRLLLFWYAVAGTSYYRVEEYAGGLWTLRQMIYDRGQGHFSYRTPPLEDGSVASWRVVPVGTNGSEGTPATWTALMVRHPDPPQVAFAYDEDTGTVAITAA